MTHFKQLKINAMILFDERSERDKIFDYFLTKQDIILVWQEEYENIATLYPEEYQQYLEQQKQN